MQKILCLVTFFLVFESGFAVKTTILMQIEREAITAGFALKDEGLNPANVKKYSEKIENLIKQMPEKDNMLLAKASLRGRVEVVKELLKYHEKNSRTLIEKLQSFSSVIHNHEIEALVDSVLAKTPDVSGSVEQEEL